MEIRIGLSDEQRSAIAGQSASHSRQLHALFKKLHSPLERN